MDRQSLLSQSKFLNENEINQLGHDPKRMALIFWSLKEAGYKLLNNPNDTFLSNISIAVNNDEFLLEMYKVKAISNYIPMQDFVLTWAINRL